MTYQPLQSEDATTKPVAGFSLCRACEWKELCEKRQHCVPITPLEVFPITDTPKEGADVLALPVREITQGRAG